LSVGVITGSGAYALPGLEDGHARSVETPYGTAEATVGRFADVEVVHVSRHGEGHVRLSNHVNHRANLWALRELGVAAAIACTACGAVDTTLALGSLVVFDDLHFASNRLPDGSLCTFFDSPGGRGRGHWIFERPYAQPLREALLEGARAAGVEVRDGGCYGHVDGPRFNTRAEIAALGAVGVTAVSQTAGPETALAGELELPFALIGYPTDYANGAGDVPTPVDELVARLNRSGEVFAAVLERSLPLIAALELEPGGVVYRFD
jgi:purine nucleoside phosphorylase